MVRMTKNRNNLNERSYTSMHYDSPVTRSQAAVLDLFKNFSNNSNMFSDPAVRSILEEELTKNPGRVMTRHMVAFRPISEIENLAKLPQQRKCRDRQHSGISPVVKYSRVKNRMSRVKKRSGSAKGRRRRSRSIVFKKNIFPKRKRRSIDRIRININDIAKASMKPPNLTDIQSQTGQEKDARIAYKTKPLTDCRDIYHSGTLDDFQNAVNRLEIGNQDESQTRQMSINGISLRNGVIFGRGKDQFYQSRNFESSLASKKEIRFDTVHDGFNTSQLNKNRTQMENNIMLGQNQQEINASPRVEKDTPLRKDTTFGKEANILTSGRNAEHDIRNREIKAATAQETLKPLLKSVEHGTYCKHIYDYSNNKNRKMKVLNGSEKPKRVSLWFGNTLSSVSSYVTKYIHFRF